MLESASFQTRARAIDHLGREQIADCPTAISELWKNAYDAYARKVELHLFDGDVPVAALVDDGHGMNRGEFESKWLTIGTDSKFNDSDAKSDDRDGLPPRINQGQKGIGRLSCAALGSLLLLISKRRDDPFIATLLDWRIFENPYLMLNDIEIPLVEFSHQDELLDLLPELFDTLLGNIWGSHENQARTVRLDEAWRVYSLQEKEQNNVSTQEAIENIVINDSFCERHFESWDVWRNKSPKGTAMFIANIQDDLLSQLSDDPLNDSADDFRARQKLFETLSNFIDPYSKKKDDPAANFKTAVISWKGQVQRPIIDEVRQYDISTIEDCEHILDGIVGDDGFFTGKVKAFGEWYEDITIRPPKNLKKIRKDTKIGPFKIIAGSYEREQRNTTLSTEIFEKLEEQKEKYSGLLLFRDSLRVMPYGREENDYFEIEKRRTKNAGLYFWSQRNIFGRIAISREHNPNLRDKAGREGLIDNKASKNFRDVVENLLITVAKKYLGRASDIRQEYLSEIKIKKDKEKADIDYKKFINSERKRIKNALNENENPLRESIQEISKISKEVSQGKYLNSLDSANELKHIVDRFTNRSNDFSLSPVPKNLGRLVDKYREYRTLEIQFKSLIGELNSTANNALQKFSKSSDYDIALKTFRSKAGYLDSRVKQWKKRGEKLLDSQRINFSKVVEKSRVSFRQEMNNDLEDLKVGKGKLATVLQTLDETYQEIEIEIEQSLMPYISALQRLEEEINLEGLVIHKSNETEKYKEELARLNSLAQLGITVEIIGHEIEGFDMTISRGLKLLKGSNFDKLEKQAYLDVLYAHQSLSERWRFLSPLKLSGERVKVKITGQDIYNYVKNFFSDTFTNRNINFSSTNRFLNIEVFEEPGRIFPVFINLINNSKYWVKENHNENKLIQLDYLKNKIIVSDNGPGVHPDDLDQLFSLFFTRKPRGGRGIGLYLCRVNLQAGGHKIYYAITEQEQVLSGANFVIEMKGIKNAG